MVGVPDNSLVIDDVGYPRVAQAKSAPHVVKARHPSGRVAAQGEVNFAVVCQSPEAFHLIGADAQYQGVSFGEGFLGISKSPVLGNSTRGVGQGKEIEDYICPPVVRKFKFSSGSEGN